MDVRYINPFIESVNELFSRMLGAKASRGDPSISSGDGRQNMEITAFIGLSGPMRGMVALSFPTSTALGIAGRLQGMVLREVDDTVSDSVSECVNIVAGSAKSKLGQNETPIDLSLPMIVKGHSYDVCYPTNARWLEVPFTSDLGPFNLRVTLAVNERKEGTTR